MIRIISSRKSSRPGARQPEVGKITSPTCAVCDNEEDICPALGSFCEWCPSTRMRISKEILVNVNAVAYSPCGKFLALSFFNELTIVRASDGIDIFNAQCSNRITSVDWSIDSDHILCLVATGCVEAFSISSPEWSCTIREGAVGLSSAVWSPKGSHIVTVAEFAVRLSVWSLIGRSVAFIENPIMKAKDKLSFSPDGGSLAVITEKMGRFNVTIFSTSWTEMSSITCDGITFPSTPIWSPNGCYISIWDTNDLTSSKIKIYDVRLGEEIGALVLEPKNWEPRGISSVIWSPNSQFLLIGCRNDSVYVINYITWNVIGIFRHEKVIEENCDVIRDEKLVKERPVKFTSIARKLPGIIKMAASWDGVLLASLSKLLPAVVWIWNLEKFALHAVVIVRNRVVDFKWGRDHKLSICDVSKVTLWHPSGTYHVDLDPDPRIRKCAWRPGTGDEFLIFTSCSMFKISG